MRWTIAVAGIFGATGVGMAAYAAHGGLDAASMDLLRRTADFQILHALALVGVGALAGVAGACRKLLALAGILFTLGVGLFCGLIYLRLLAQIGDYQFLVPWGGTSLMLGWLVLACAGVFRRKSGRGEIHTL